MKRKGEQISSDDGGLSDVVEYFHTNFLQRLSTIPDLVSWHSTKKSFASEWRERDYVKRILKASIQNLKEQYGRTLHAECLRLNHRLLEGVTIVEVLEKLVTFLPTFEYMEDNIHRVGFGTDITEILGKDPVINNQSDLLSMNWTVRTTRVLCYLKEFYGWYGSIYNKDNIIIDRTIRVPKSSKFVFSINEIGVGKKL